MSFEEQHLQLNGKWAEFSLFEKTLTPGVIMTLPWGYIHAYYHCSQSNVLIYISGLR